MMTAWEWLGDNPPMGFARERSGTVRATTPFPPRLLITGELLRAADPRLLHHAGRILTVSVTNGEARYRLVRRWKTGDRMRTFGAVRLP